MQIKDNSKTDSVKSARVSRVLVDTNLTDCSAIDLNEKYINQTLTSLTGHNDITMIRSRVCSTPSTVDRSIAGNIMLNVYGKEYPFIYDTGSEISVVPTSFLPSAFLDT